MKIKIVTNSFFPANGNFTFSREITRSAIESFFQWLFGTNVTDTGNYKISLKRVTNFITILTLFTSTANAEYCDMSGDAGKIAWIWVPKSQHQLNGKDKINYNGKSYKYDRSHRLFKEDKLPMVNDIITLNVNVASTDIPICTTSENCSNGDKRFEEMKRIDSGNSTIYDKEKGMARINDSAYEGNSLGGGKRGNWDLNSGAKLRVMGYTYVDQVLFALVYVESC